MRRRHLITKKGREVTGLDDEVFDQRAIADAGLEVAGEGALLAALERDRTGRMGDIVATIQAEQDQAIRAEIAGILVVAGGPGTGKTAVALAPRRVPPLHAPAPARVVRRAARRAEPGVPALHRAGAAVARRAGRPALDTHRPQAPPARRPRSSRDDVAALKGDARMARVIERAVADRERPLAGELVLVIDGLRSAHHARRHHPHRRRRRAGGEAPTTRSGSSSCVASSTCSSRATRKHSSATSGPASSTRRASPTAPTRRTAAQNRVGNVTSIFDRDATADPTVAGALARGEAPPEGWESELRARIRNRPEVREALERCWPVISGAELVNDLFGFSALTRSAARDILSEADMARLHRRRDPNVQQVAWSEADIPLIDEADALLGPVEAARPRRRRRRSSEDALDTANRVIEDLGLHGFTDAASLAEPLRRRQQRRGRVDRRSRARTATSSSTKRRT